MPNRTDAEKLDDFLNNLKKITETGNKVISIIGDVVDTKDIIEAQEILDDLEIKPFGNLGGHIVVPYKYVGKKVKVIIKK